MRERFVLLVALLAANGCSKTVHRIAITTEELAEIDRAFAQANGDDDVADRAFLEQAMKVAALQPGSAPCRVPFSEGDLGRLADRVAAAVGPAHGSAPQGTRVLQAEYVTIVDGPIESLHSASRVVRRDEEERLRGREGQAYEGLEGEELVSRARELVTRPLPAELLIVIDSERRAHPIDDASFAGGSIAARAYLYHDGHFACAGNLLANSSKSIEVWYQQGQRRDDTAYLSGDLYANLVEAAKTSLRAIAGTGEPSAAAGSP